MPTLEQRVTTILSRVAMVPEARVTPDAELAALGMQSLDQIECVLSVEEEFQVELPQGDLWRLRTVQDVIDAVRGARAAGGG